jgi:4-amino-4-deoxy-L-arabinose transferase-like glycosyltransferase
VSDRLSSRFAGNIGKVQIFLVLVLALPLLFTNLDSVLKTVEGYWACIVQQMNGTGQIFELKIGYTDYFDKPYLSYWLQLLFSKISGGVTETTLRLPSVFAALASLVLSFVLSHRWFGRRVAVMASLILLTTVQFLRWGTDAETEMLNMASILLLIWMFFRFKDSPGNLWFYALTAMMAVGSWIKGPMCYVIPGLVILLHSLIFRDWKWFRGNHFVLAGMLSIALYFSLFVVAWLATGKWDALYMVYRENVLRFVAPFDHEKPWYFYALYLWKVLLPWVLFFVLAIFYVLKNWRTTPQETKQLLLVIAAIFLFFSFSGSKRYYYLIPILPFTSMLLAYFFDMLPKLSTPWRMGTGSLWILLGSVCVILAATAILLHLSNPTNTVGRLTFLEPAGVAKVWPILESEKFFILSVVWLAAGVFIFFAGTRRASFSTTLSLIGALYTLFFMYYVVAVPEFERFSGKRGLAQTIVKTVSANEEVIFYPGLQPSLLFYLDDFGGLPNYTCASDIQKVHRQLQGGRGFLIAREDEIGPVLALWEPIVREQILRLLKKDRVRPWGLFRPKRGSPPPPEKSFSP